MTLAPLGPRRNSTWLGLVALLGLGVSCTAKPNSIEIAEAPLILYSVEGVDLPTVKIVDDQGKALDPMPAVEWSVEPPGPFFVDKGRVVPVTNGKATLVAKVRGTQLQARHPLKIQIVDRVDLACSQANCQYRVGDDVRISAELWSSGQKIEADPGTWEARAASVLKTKGRGVWSASSAGASEVTFRIGTTKAIRTVNVSAAADKIDLPCPPTAVQRKNGKDRCFVGREDELTLEPKVWGQGVAVHAAEPKWKSSDTEVATIDAPGVVFGRGVGTATISAEMNGVKGELLISVGITCTKRHAEKVSIVRRFDRYLYSCRIRNAADCLTQTSRRVTESEALALCCCEFVSVH